MGELGGWAVMAEKKISVAIPTNSRRPRPVCHDFRESLRMVETNIARKNEKKERKREGESLTKNAGRR